MDITSSESSYQCRDKYPLGTREHRQTQEQDMNTVTPSTVPFSGQAGLMEREADSTLFLQVHRNFLLDPPAARHVGLVSWLGTKGGPSSIAPGSHQLNFTTIATLTFEPKKGKAIACHRSCGLATFDCPWRSLGPLRDSFLLGTRMQASDIRPPHLDTVHSLSVCLSALLDPSWTVI